MSSPVIVGWGLLGLVFAVCDGRREGAAQERVPVYRTYIGTSTFCLFFCFCRSSYPQGVFMKLKIISRPCVFEMS